MDRAYYLFRIIPFGSTHFSLLIIQLDENKWKATVVMGLIMNVITNVGQVSKETEVGDAGNENQEKECAGKGIDQ